MSVRLTFYFLVLLLFQACLKQKYRFISWVIGNSDVIVDLPACQDRKNCRPVPFFAFLANMPNIHTRKIPSEI
jgi:hypothetical protein